MNVINWPNNLIPRTPPEMEKPTSLKPEDNDIRGLMHQRNYVSVRALAATSTIWGGDGGSFCAQRVPFLLSPSLDIFRRGSSMPAVFGLIDEHLFQRPGMDLRRAAWKQTGPSVCLAVLDHPAAFFCCPSSGPRAQLFLVSREVKRADGNGLVLGLWLGKCEAICRGWAGALVTKE